MPNSRTRSGLGAVLAALILAGCSSTGTAQVATAGGDAATGGPPSASAPLSQEDQRLQFTACLRDNGIDISDDAGRGGAPPDVDGIDPDGLQRALDACADLVPAGADGGALGTNSGADQERWLALAQCMRDEGIDFPDPTFDEQGRLDLRPGAAGIDPGDPAVRTALATCQERTGLQIGGPQS